MNSPTTIDVFISYKKEERSYADLTQRVLEQAGYRVVTDSQIGPSEDFSEALDQMIRNARCVLVLWTPAAAASVWVKREARMAVDLKTYLGVMVEPTDLRMDFRDLNYVSVGEGLKAALPDVLDAVKELIGIARSSAEEAEAKGADDERELTYFQAMERVGSATAFRKYQEAYPNGQFIDIATENLRALTNWRARAKRWLPNAAAVGLVIAAMGLGLRWYGTQYGGEVGLRDEVAQLEAQNAKLLAQVQAGTGGQAEADLKAEIARLNGALGDAADEVEAKKAEAQQAADQLAALAAAGKQAGAAQVAEIARLKRVLRDAEVQEAEAAKARRAAEAKLTTRINRLTTANERLTAERDKAVHSIQATARKPGITPPIPEPDCETGGKDGYDILGTCYARDITSLSFAGKKDLKDISKLAGLTALTTLDLSGTGVEDVTPLSGLTALTWLRLWDTGVEDVTPLSGLTALKSLQLWDTGVEDVTPLSGLTALTVLNLAGTGVKDVTPLSGLTALTWLSLLGTGVEDVTPLSGLTALKWLQLWDTGVEDVTPLSGLTALTVLNLAGTGVKDVTPLSGLTALTWLSLLGTGVEDVTPLSGLTGLKQLNLGQTNVRDIRPLRGHSKLHFLRAPDGADYGLWSTDTAATRKAVADYLAGL